MRHPDEGEIHAWLDGALAVDEAARIEAHVASCARCAEEVGTARGLIAGASRILLALDDVQGGVLPARPATSETPAPASEPVAAAVPLLAHSRGTNAPVRRHVPWFSRPLTRIAAGLVLAAGVGTVAVRRDPDVSNRLTIDLRTESPAAGAGSDEASLRDLQQTAPRQLEQDANAGVARAAVRVQAPPAASTAVAERLATSSSDAAKIGSSTPPSDAVRTAARSTPAPLAAREEARAEVSATGSSTPTQATVRDSAWSDRQSPGLRNTVVAGAATGAATQVGTPPASAATFAAPRLGFAVSRPSPAGSCYALELDPASPVVRGELPLPRTLRIRLADLQNVAAEAVRPPLRGANLLSDTAERLRRLERSAVPQAAAAAPVEPVETVEWETVAPDSVIARQLAGIDVIILRLSVAGDEVHGTAVAQRSAAAPVRVTGRRIACDGSF